jgi:hypothetical protein
MINNGIFCPYKQIDCLKFGKEITITGTVSCICCPFFSKLKEDFTECGYKDGFCNDNLDYEIVFPTEGDFENCEVDNES